MINYRLLFIVSFLILAFAGLGLLRLDIDTDVVRSLPSGDKVIADGLDIFEHHPIQDQIAVDIALNIDDPDMLVEIGTFLEKKMKDSGLFAQVGTEAISELIPDLAVHAAQNLPLLFSREELEQKVAPLLETEKINKRLLQLYQDLSSMEGIGQAGFIGLDPLGLKDLVLAKMAPLAPSLNTSFYRGSCSLPITITCWLLPDRWQQGLIQRQPVKFLRCLQIVPRPLLKNIPRRNRRQAAGNFDSCRCLQGCAG